MERMQASTVVKQFKQVFDESSVNELGKATRLCRREREATPYRLILTLLEAFATDRLESIADIHRTFNALCEKQMHYKPFHNQLAKPGFASFALQMLNRVLNGLACEVLRFSPESPFARFERIRIQDGSSFALKAELADVFPGRWRHQKPAAVELHVDLDLMSETLNEVVLSPDSASERQFLPAPESLRDELLLADRGYFGTQYLQAVDAAGGLFIVRGKSNMNPVILRAIDPDGREVKAFRGQRLKALKTRMSRYAWVDMAVRFDTDNGGFEARLVVHPNLRGDDTPRYLVTNLDADSFSAEQISDGYRLRWQVELLFKEWKSHTNLRAFNTANPNIAEGLIWASLCAATLQRYCAHVTQRIRRVAISTRTAAKCIHHVLRDVLYDLLHHRQRLHASVERTIDYLSRNARRAHPKRDRESGRLKLGLFHVYAGA